MRRMHWAALVLSVLLASCASDGGSSGTGITSVEGNVLAVQRSAAASAALATHATGVAGILVTIDGTHAEATTDAAGHFAVGGKFEGLATLRFARDADALAATMAIVVPRGGTLTLADVAIAADTATAASRHAVYDARVTGVDCTAPSLRLMSIGIGDDGYVYTVDLGGGFVHDADGTAIDCSEIRVGDRVHVEASARPDWTFGDADVMLER